VSNGRDLIRAAPQLKPDVVIVDIAMPLLNGLDAAQRVRTMLRAVKIVFLTMRSDPEIVAEAFRREASAYVVKTCAASQLLTAVRNVLRGEAYLSPVLSRGAVDFLQ
jgi:DNA-binding NarL/FixJ family response regulator